MSEAKAFAWRQMLVEYLEAGAIAVVLAAFIMTFIARSFTVDGVSMYPTLHNGERLLVDEISYRFHAPRRGDIVVFRYPANPSERFIKRVIGLPGDTVVVQNGAVYLNGIKLHEPYIAEPTYERPGTYVVPPGTLFVMGDNRNNSEDSRFPDVGYVPRGNVIGKAVFRFWPLSRMGLIERPQALASPLLDQQK